MAKQLLFFDVNTISQTNKQEPKKRGRPKKQEPPVTKQEPKKRGRKPKQVEQVKETESRLSKSKVTNPEVNKTEKQTPDSGWIDYYNDKKPNDFAPCEFYVQMGRKKSPVFRGYIQQGYIFVLDDPYHGIAMRKKYKNLYYRPLCSSLSGCPNGFPDCKRCKVNKSKKK